MPHASKLLSGTFATGHETARLLIGASYRRFICCRVCGLGLDFQLPKFSTFIKSKGKCRESTSDFPNEKDNLEHVSANISGGDRGSIYYDFELLYGV
jgi:hypothetical protein